MIIIYRGNFFDRYNYYVDDGLQIFLVAYKNNRIRSIYYVTKSLVGNNYNYNYNRVLKHGHGIEFYKKGNIKEISFWNRGELLEIIRYTKKGKKEKTYSGKKIKRFKNPEKIPKKQWSLIYNKEVVKRLKRIKKLNIN